MEPLKPIHPSRSKVALLATACLLIPISASETTKNSNLASRETTRRSLAIDEAQELLKKGDEAYQRANYADAVEAYAGARELIPEAPITAELRSAATQRYAQAAVEHARYLSRKGDLAGAKLIVDQVLASSVDPTNLGALTFRAQLDDPIRTNPSLTPAIAKEIDSIRQLLYVAEGEFNLGKFDQSKSSYEAALRIDPTNTAARRGLEQVAAAKGSYYKASYDQTRSELLGMVDKEWEMEVPPLDFDQLANVPNISTLENSQISITNKLNRIIIPKLGLDQVSLDEAIEFLRLRASENDTLETNPERKGVNFTINLGPPESPAAQKIRDARFTLQLMEVPLVQALKYITEITHTSFRTDDFSVLISAVGSTSDQLQARNFRVPPDFIGNLSTASITPAPADPFAEKPAQGLLPKRLGAQEALENQGVSFPEGASASYIASNSTLRVVNTIQNLDYIDQIVSAASSTEPILVTVKVTMIRVQQTRLKELGFDWLLDNFGFGGPSWVPGNSMLNLSGGTVGNQGALEGINPIAGVTALNPITAGNRSGDFAISPNSIDERIDHQAGTQINRRGPSVMNVRGTLNDTGVMVLMRGLDQKKGVDFMAQPSVVTRSGQASSVHIVREFIYPTEYEPPELPQNTGNRSSVTVDEFGFTSSNNSNSKAVTPATPTAFEKRDVGITLEVLPVVDANKQYVTVTLNPVFSAFDGFVNYGSPINSTEAGLFGPETVELTKNSILQPIFSKQALSSSIDVADGTTVVVGGMIQETVQNVQDQTPILGSIPIIGRLFQSAAKQPVTTNVIFLVKADIIDPAGRNFNHR